VSSGPQPVSVKILDKEYRIACEEGQREGLIACARYLDERMREIRRSGRVIGTERIAVMAALNITHDLLEQTGAKAIATDSIHRRLSELQDRIELALNTTNELEL
jgi:cell division protein ZapA